MLTARDHTLSDDGEVAAQQAEIARRIEAFLLLATPVQNAH